MELTQLKYFQAMAKCHHFTQAAEEMAVSQSALSRSIQKLEQELGVTLFERHGRMSELTEAGQKFLFHVDRVIRELALAEQEIELDNGGAGVVHLSFLHSLGDTFLPLILRQFHERYPAIRLKVLNGTSYEALQMLRAGQVDLAFASTPQETGNLQMRRCMALHNVFVVGQDYPCETDRAYTLAELSRFPLILLERKSSARRYLERFFTRNGITLKPEIELCSHELLVDLAAIGLGVACITREFALPALEAGTIRELRTIPEIPERSLSVCTLQDVAPSPAAEEFLRFWA